MKTLLLKISAWLNWAMVQTYPLWLTLLVPLGGLLIALVAGESFLKFYALIIQLGGGWIATSVIRENLQIFQAGGMKAAILGWWSRRPRHQNITVNLQGCGATITGGAARIRTNIGRAPDDSLETQLDMLWASHHHLWAEVDTNRHDLECKLGEVHIAVQDVKAAHDRGTRELTEVVRKVAASSPLRAYFGVWMAAVGTVLSTYTQAIAVALFIST